MGEHGEHREQGKDGKHQPADLKHFIYGNQKTIFQNEENLMGKSKIAVVIYGCSFYIPMKWDKSALTFSFLYHNGCLILN